MALLLPTARGSLWLPPAPGNGTDQHLGLSKLGLLASYDDVAGHGELAASPQGEPVYPTYSTDDCVVRSEQESCKSVLRGNNWFADLANVLPKAEHISCQDIPDTRPFVHFLYVRSSCESFVTGPSQHKATHSSILITSRSASFVKILETYLV